MTWFSSVVFGLLVGLVGTGLGALLVTLIKRPGESTPGLMMGFSGGIMMAIVVFDMIPEANEQGGLSVTLVGLVIGVLALWLIHALVPHHHGHQLNSADAKKREMLHTGVLLLVGIGLHNLPEGLAIGTGLLAGDGVGPNYGLQLGLLIFLHNIPEGIALAIPFRLGGKGTWTLVGLGLLAGLPTGFGAIIGYLLGGLSDLWIAGCIAFAAGAMAFVTVFELVPNTLAVKNKKWAAASMAVGLAVGYLLIALVEG